MTEHTPEAQAAYPNHKDPNERGAYADVEALLELQRSAFDRGRSSMVETVTSARSGTCTGCGLPLVQVMGETYHPAETYPPDTNCPETIPIRGTDSFSFEVRSRAFRPDREEGKG